MPIIFHAGDPWPTYAARPDMPSGFVEIVRGTFWPKRHWHPPFKTYSLATVCGKLPTVAKHSSARRRVPRTAAPPARDLSERSD
jgi:hypothetical protein